MELASRFLKGAHLYKRPCPLVSWLVRRSVGWLVGNTFVKISEKWIFTLDFYVLDEETGRTWRKE